MGLIVNPVVFSSISNDWKTPQAIYNQLDFEFHFTFDPCPYQSNELMALLTKEWRGSVFVNPPYDNIENFMDKALLELRKGNARVVVFLVPSATSTDWWHNYVVPFCKDIRWIKGRLKFANDKKGDRGSAPFASCILVFRNIFDKSLKEFF